MILNKEELYAIKLLLSFEQEGYICSLGDFSEKIGISKPYVYKIVRKLKEAGLIGSHKGSNGGYYLTRSLSKISLFDVHTALHNKLDNNYHQYDKSYMNSKMKIKLNNIDRNIVSLLKKIKLSEMM